MSISGIDTNVTTPVVNNNSTSNSSLDKDAFLQLLVAQMQYQDPLQPTSNTEYMAQLAQFSTVEELQNLGTDLTNGQALNLTGQYVILNVPDSTGNISQISGLVDYVTLKEGQTYFHIGEEYYPSEYLDSVVSLDYLEYLAGSNMQPDNDNETVEDGSAENGNKTDGTEQA